MRSRLLGRLVVTIGVAGVVALAGCGGDDGGSEDSGEDGLFSLVEIQDCVEENGYTVAGEQSALTPDEAIGLVASLPVVDSGNGLVQVIEFETDADAASYVETANEGTAIGKFVVGPGNGTTEADVDVVSGCIE